jgi:H+/gluconate symporter-like permease
MKMIRKSGAYPKLTQSILKSIGRKRKDNTGLLMLLYMTKDEK